MIPRLALLLTLLLAQTAAAGTRVMLLGDSLTAQGEGRRPLYDRLTAEGWDFEFVGSQGAAPLLHEGHGGFTIGPDQSRPGNLFDNVDDWITAARPDVIFLLVGNNDFNGKPGVNPVGAPERLAALLEKIAAAAPQAEVIVSTGLKIAFVDDYAGALNREIPGIVKTLRARELKVHLADLNAEVDLVRGAPPFNGPDSDYSDGTHLNAAGGKKLADVRFSHLVPFLQKRKN
jgi:hypothetical protein